jgi:hypothetical protein
VHCSVFRKDRGIRKLHQLRVLRLSGDENRDVGVGVFPQGEEILIRGAGLCGVALHRVNRADVRVIQRSGSLTSRRNLSKACAS